MNQGEGAAQTPPLQGSSPRRGSEPGLNREGHGTSPRIPPTQFDMSHATPPVLLPGSPPLQGLGDHNSDNPPSQDPDDNGGSDSGSLSSGEDEPLPFQKVQEANWVDFYLRCPVFAILWLNTHTAGAVWPKGIRVAKGRLYQNDKLCIPTGLQKPWIREYHAFSGHVGPDRLWDHLALNFEFAWGARIKEFVDSVSKKCETCQANQRAYRLAGPEEATPVPAHIMTHVALDIFQMPAAELNNKCYDAMAVCVDRHSGWVVAVPCTYKGLTGRVVAQAMVREWRFLASRP